MSDLAAQKAALRAQALTARAAGGDQAALTDRLRDVLAAHRGSCVAAYWPIRGEADPLPALAGWDGPVVLPVVPGSAQPLLFRQWQGEALERGPLGTRNPPESAPLLRPDVVLVPLAAFDPALNRLGYGGGFYDRTLEQLRQGGEVAAIGVAWAVQQVTAIPAEPTDQPLDLLVTDRETLGAAKTRR